MASEITYINKKQNVKLLDNSPIGARAGGFIFLGSQTPMDLERATLVSGLSDIPSGAQKELEELLPAAVFKIRFGGIAAQTWRIYQNIKEILEEEGSSLDNILHQRIFLQDRKDMPLVERVIKKFMPEKLPATTVIEATNEGANKEILIQVDLIALDGHSPLQTENIRISDMDWLTAPFPLATKAGQYLFTSSIPGADLKTRKVLSSISELAAEDRKLVPEIYDNWEEAPIAQQLAAFRHIDNILKSQGASIGDWLHQYGWLRMSVPDSVSPVGRLRRKVIPAERQKMAPWTTFYISGLRNEASWVEFQIAALIPPKGSDEYSKEIPTKIHTLSATYLGVVKAGPLIFTVGEVAIDTKGPKLVNKFAELTDEGSFIPYGRIHPDLPIMAEGWHVYQSIKADLESFNTPMTNVVHQSVYMANPSDYPALERIATMFYGAKLPPTTVVPIVHNTGPFRKGRLEIAVIALSAE